MGSQPQNLEGRGVIMAPTPQQCRPTSDPWCPGGGGGGPDRRAELGRAAGDWEARQLFTPLPSLPVGFLDMLTQYHFDVWKLLDPLLPEITTESNRWFHLAFWL